MEDESLKMIPTRGRTKIPASLSYVAGAKMLSLALQDVPQFDLLTLAFSCSNVAAALRPQKRSRQILEVSYWELSINQFSSRTMEEIGLHGPRWQVTVGVCRREDAHDVREWLTTTGLSHMRAWLEQKVYANRARYWAATFDEDSRVFDVEGC